MTDSKQIEKILTAARHHLEKKEFKNAQLMYYNAQNLTKDEKTRAIIWAELSWVYYYQGDYEKSIESAENVLMHDPQYKALGDLFRVQGYGYLALRNDKLAEKYLTDSLQADADSDKQQFVKFELGKLYFGRGQYDQAYPYFRQIEDYFLGKESEYFISTQFYLGFIYYYLENNQKARKHFENILKLRPPATREASAFYGLAYIEFREKNYLNVISLCEKIMTLNEDFFDRESVGFLTAASYFYLGRKDIFQEYYDQMRESYPHGRYTEELKKLNLLSPGSDRKN